MRVIRLTHQSSSLVSYMSEAPAPSRGFTQRALATVERVGNKLPDPAVLFIALLFIVWVLSWLLSYVSFDVIDPRTTSPLDEEAIIESVEEPFI